MKLHDAPNNTVNTLAPEDAGVFTIEANATAFSILFDGLYSNKIRAVVREICTNAADSHIDAGCGSMPFDVTLPGIYDPTFRVRDYGVSLTHEQVMGLYTRAFDSSKRDSNDVTGAFGLGSKSPFAYSDRFEVIARLNGEKRTYLAVREPGQTPTISLLSTVPCDEAQGLEIAVPARSEDFKEWETEMRMAILGFDPMPSVNGGAIKIDAPIFSDEDGKWNIFNPDALPGSNTLLVRQGCVIYPVDHTSLNYKVGSVFSSGKKIVVDLPIGSCSVAASREALQFDDRTIEAVNKAVEGAIEGWKKQVYAEADKCRNYIEAQKFWYESDDRSIARIGHIKPMWKGREVSNYVDLTKMGANVDPPLVRRGRSRRAVRLDRYPFSERQRVVFVVYRPESETKIPRSIMRFMDYCDTRGYSDATRTFLLTEPSKELLSGLIKHFDLDPKKQIIHVSTLPDPGPPVRIPKVGGPSRKGNLAGVNRIVGPGVWEPISELPADYLWVCINERITAWGTETPYRRYSEAVGAGMKEIPLLAFTTVAKERHNPDPKKEHTTAIENFLNDNVDDFLKAYEDNAFVNELPGVGMAREIFGREIRGWVDRMIGWEAKAKINKKVKEEVAELAAKYPLLFPSSSIDKKYVQWYIDMCDEQREEHTND